MQVRSLISPLPFMSTLASDKLYDESQRLSLQIFLRAANLLSSAPAAAEPPPTNSPRFFRKLWALTWI